MKEKSAVHWEKASILTFESNILRKLREIKNRVEGPSYTFRYTNKIKKVRSLDHSRDIKSLNIYGNLCLFL